MGIGPRFTFPALPERIQAKYGAKYQSFDIISQGAVKIPKGMDVTEITWEGTFFGATKRKEPIVKKSAWKSPKSCVRILYNFMRNGTILNLIVTETWINMDVTISSFQPKPVGAYGNIEYSITFAQKKPLRIYTTNELGTAESDSQIKPRNDTEVGASPESVSYTVVSGDTLWSIAAKKLGAGSRWTSIYDANSETIEAEAKRHGKANSDHGNWIWPGEVLTIPGGSAHD